MSDDQRLESAENAENPQNSERDFLSSIHLSSNLYYSKTETLAEVSVGSSVITFGTNRNRIISRIIDIISIIDPKMSKMSIIHATEKLKLRGALLYCNILKQFFVFILTHIIDIISIIGPKMSKMSIIHKTREKNFYPLFVRTV